jgi:prepilin-type N-terminal cleavage/methylation domain-containing protein
MNNDARIPARRTVKCAACLRARDFARMSRGFTLIEVLISVVVLAVGVVLILRAMETTLTALGSARDTLWASTIASTLAEEARFNAASAGSVSDVTGSSAGTRDTPHGVFRWSMKTGSDISAGIETETVVISVWRDGNSAPFILTTAVRKPPQT